MADILEKVDKFVLQLFTEKLPNTFIYHNYNHTQRVVKSTKELIENSEINVKEEQALILAAWLHDTGYTVKSKGHEEESIRIAEDFLSQENVDKETIEMVKKYISTTRMLAIPETLPEKIIKDADSSHLAKDYFEETTEFLRQELKIQKVCNFSTNEWMEENIKLFTEKHRYYTPYAIKEWKPKKDENLLSILESQKKLSKKYDKEKAKAKFKTK